jgi:hypothetical protein
VAICGLSAPVRLGLNRLSLGVSSKTESCFSVSSHTWTV